MKSKEVSIARRLVQQVHAVLPYSLVHGTHPSLFVATMLGWFKKVSSRADHYTGKGPSTNAAKREIIYPSEKLSSLRHPKTERLSTTLKAGACWEMSEPLSLSINSPLETCGSQGEREKALRRWLFDHPMIDPLPAAPVRNPSARAKHQGKQGARDMKDIEHATDENAGLTPEAATAERAPSARCNYFAQDRPDKSFSAK